MKPLENPDAAPDPSAAASAARTRPATGLGTMLAALRVELDRHEHRSVLRLEPMPAAFAVRPLIEAPGLATGPALLLRPEGVPGPALDEAAASVGARPIDVLAPNWIVADDSALHAILTCFALPTLSIIRIDGPVEPADAEALAAAIRAGRSPFAAEIRTTFAASFLGDGSMVAESGDVDPLLALVAERLRLYLAGIRSVSPDEVARPELGLVHRLLDRTGRLSVRPIETEVFSTAVDVGFSTDPEGPGRPADASLVYDLHANSWHGD